MIPAVLLSLTSPAGVMAMVAGCLALALGRSPDGLLLAAVRPDTRAAPTVFISVAVYAGATAVNSAFNT